MNETQTTKFCKDCKFHLPQKGDNKGTNSKCTKQEKPAGAAEYAVTGVKPPLDAMYFYCTVQRESDSSGACGIDGAWFEAAPLEKEAA